MDEKNPHPETTLALQGGDKAFLYVVGPVLGIAAGLLLPWLAKVAADYPVPFGGFLELIGSFDSPLVVAARPLVGALLGLAGAALLIHLNPVIRVGDEHIRVTTGSDTRRIPRDQVAGVYRQSGKLVIESHQGRELYKGDVDGSKEAVRDAFVSRGYPWENE